MVTLSNAFVRRCDVTIAAGLYRGPLVEDLDDSIPVIQLGSDRARTAAVPLLRAIRRVHPDAVLSTLGFNLAVSTVRRLAPPSTRIVMREGNTLSAFLADVDRDSPSRAAFYRAVYPMLYRGADRIVCQSDFMRADLASTLGLPASSLGRIYNPVDLGRVKRGLRDRSLVDAHFGRPHLLAIGRFVHQKGFDVLLRAFVRVKQTYPTASLTLLGDGTLRGEFKQFAANAGLADSIRFPGWVKNPFRWVAAADRVVSSSRYEGLSNVLLEAMAAGLGVIATDCPGGTQETVGVAPFSVLVPSEDNAALAEGILASLREPVDPALQASYVERGFSVGHIAESYLEELLPSSIAAP